MAASTSLIDEHLAFPGESAAYRAARNDLLEAEVALRRQIETVAAQRRALPPGGVAADYVFERIGAHQRPEPVTLSELFGDHSSILLYSFMFAAERDRPCPGCTHMLDSWDGAVFHATRRLPIYIVAKSPIARLEAWARTRGWRNLTFLSDPSGDYTRDYFGDTRGFGSAMRAARGYKDGENWDQPMTNVFRRDADGTVSHSWGSEILYVQEEDGQHHRAGDLVDPLWGFLDMTAEGRGDFNAALTYDANSGDFLKV